ncbi:L-serine dehydratase [Anaerobacterium chartisolvens]|uniref:L-serine deaminase n=1 Tax=Anaerobacterium chartisolvens TaxID=1297424 RepID=A0A369AJM0_9FIRM|nr:L-serine ammonia-lyase, iron-sulfur-dependent subunit beta [Anaerobacterium chartisolvens]RCX09572.1 L-serine dehydratase [Anaerobacterium chartisolvens]
MNIFDIIGPVMIGPSSSHTAGAVRLAGVARLLLGERVKSAYIKLHGSFAETYKGHGTDKAIIGGLMGYLPDDPRIRESIELAEQEGMTFSIETASLGDVHPNTALISVEGVSGKKASILGSSIGGGNIVIKQIDGMSVEFTGQYNSLIVEYTDRPRMVAMITSIIGDSDINIANMKVYRSARGGKAIMTIEIDQEIPEELVNIIRRQRDVFNVINVKMV